MSGNNDLYKLGEGPVTSQPPADVIKIFFQERSIEDLMEILGDMLFVVLTCDSLQFETGIQRDNAIYTVRQLLRLAIAAKSLVKTTENEEG